MITSDRSSGPLADLAPAHGEPGARYRAHFEAVVAEIRGEGRYRTFADLQRVAEQPPFAVWRNAGSSQRVVFWCSNNYLGMGRHPRVIEAMTASARSQTDPAQPKVIANYPAVARGTERLRITPTPYHDDGLIRDLASALGEVWTRLRLASLAGQQAAAAASRRPTRDPAPAASAAGAGTEEMRGIPFGAGG
jgi:hypothetical protein